ncbi:MAG: hypothetical protein IPK25_15820 [Saprospiraceae bacterium]|nr:hypothetical protein [Saprospiraceae bacterium]
MTGLAQEIIHYEKSQKSGILNLNNCGLTEIPPEIYEMDWVRVLNLSNGRYWNPQNEEFRDIPDALSRIERNEFIFNYEINFPTNLNVISFGNSILKISKYGRLVLNNVRTLDIANNSLDNLNFIKEAKTLKQLDLFNNNFLHLGPIIEMIEVLKYLNLRHNKISIIDEVIGPNNLETLLLGNNYINRINDVSQFFKLINLDLAVNSISKIEGLESMYLLKDLSLAQNKITKIENLWSNTELRSLHLGYNPISKIENLSHLAKLQKLKLKMLK